MSLTFQSEHLAWKQRVNQEVNRANSFYNSMESFYARSSSRNTRTAPPASNPNQLRETVYEDPRKFTASTESWASSSRFSQSIMNNPKLRQQYDDNQYKHSNYNLAYSFGGSKPIKNALKSQGDLTPAYSTVNEILAPKQNSLVSRPSTAGSYVSRGQRSSVGSQQGKMRTKFQEQRRQTASVPKRRQEQATPDKQGGSPVKPPLPYTPTYKHKVIRAPPYPKPEDFPPPRYEDEEQEKQEEEEVAEELDELREELESKRPASAATSVRTTESQRQYIQELERLLFEERKKRIMAENQAMSMNQTQKSKN